MVDFSKRLEHTTAGNTVDPVKLYESLDRASDKGPLRPAQEAILNEWNVQHRNERDVIVKLHTGQGKTLIGLLMLQSKINEDGGSAVYLCPNNFLIKQTALQAKQFGVQYCTSDGDLPHEFIDGKSILIASVQKLFNGLSKFGTGSRSLPVSTLLMDDCHACIDAIRDAFVIQIKRSEGPFQPLLDLFSASLQDQGIGTFAEIQKGDFGSFLAVPYWDWLDRQTEVIQLLAKHTELAGIKYAWPVMRDRLAHSLCIISGQRIEITPYLPPLELFGSYWKAKHRIFMSATVTDDSFLVKGLRISPENVKKPLVFAKERWSGEKMVLIPSLLNDSLDRETIIKEFGIQRPQRKYGVLALTPTFKTAEEWQTEGASLVKPDTIEREIDMLKAGQCETTIVAASRYDGIDLPDDACRILILDSLPRGQALSDRYIEHCRAGSVVTAIRTARTIEQGLGRSVRGEKDYSVIVITGAELVKELRSKHFRKYLSEQTNKQIELGLEIAEMGRAEIEKGQQALDVFYGLIDQCLKRNPNWKSFYSENMDKIIAQIREGSVLAVFELELLAEEQFQRGEPDKAVKTVQKLIDLHIKETIDKAWYMQEMARFTYCSSKVDSNKLQLSAHRTNGFVLKPREGIQITRLQVHQKRVSAIIDWLKSFESTEELILAIDELSGRLQFGVDADRFEKAIDDLGCALGFATERPDKEWKAGPDNLWCLQDGDFLLIECKSEVRLDRTDIFKDESGQMNNACAWFSETYPGAIATRIIIIPASKLGAGAGFNESVRIMRKKELTQLIKNAKAFFSEFRGVNAHSLTEQRVQELIQTHHLSNDALKTEFHIEPR